MIESVVYLLIELCIIAIVVYLVLWVLQQIGIPLPPKVIQLLWVIAGLVALLLLIKLFLGAGGVHRLLF